MKEYAWCLVLILVNCCLQSCSCAESSLGVCTIPGVSLTFRGNETVKRKVRRLTKRDTRFEIGFNDLALGGDTVFEDANIFRALGKFARERIPERVVHAKGVTAFGTFHVTSPMISRLCSASVFQPGTITKIAVRFSTSVGELGSPDTAFGEVRGFGIKFYTDDGNLDLLGINVPIFFINDPQLFPHLMRALKRDPASDLRTTDAFWDFISLRPEALNTVTMLFTDFGLPDGYRHMPGFAVSAFKLTNGQHYSWAKFAWLPVLGTRFLNLANATKIAG